MTKKKPPENKIIDVAYNGYTGCYEAIRKLHPKYLKLLPKFHKARWILNKSKSIPLEDLKKDETYLLVTKHRQPHVFEESSDIVLITNIIEFKKDDGEIESAVFVDIEQMVLFGSDYNLNWYFIEK